MIDFTLYPNMGGNLGENKVQIPDGVTTFWPDGDAMVGNFIYKDGKLSGLVDTKALIANESKSTTIPYDFVETEFENVREDSVKFNLSDRCKNFTLKLIPKYKGCKTLSDIKAIDANYIENDIVDGAWTKDLEDLRNGLCLFYNCDSIITFSSNLTNLTVGDKMFYECNNLDKFDVDLSSLTDGNSMFWSCDNLTSFVSNLHSLINGYYMLFGCTNLINFETSNLSSLTNGTSMFRGCGISSFTYDLSSLTNGICMFYYCSNLKTFKSDLSSLTNAQRMFDMCNNLVSFKSNLKSLTDGSYMFGGCKLDTPSLKNIAETINTVSDSPDIHIGIGSKTPTEEENTYLTQIHNKGWQVYVNGSGNAYVPTDNTALIPIDGEQNINPIPFWAKPVPSTQEEANYIDENGNFFNILGGQFIYVNDPETYGMFTSEEDAAANMRLIKIEKEEK